MPSSAPRSAARPDRFGGLDGLRAIAVGLVLAYHLFPGLLPGGFLGVDVFFVISGFLITSLLLRELELSGGIRLGDFWRRRARRLLPALALVLLVSTALALLTGGDLLVGIGGQLAGAALFVSNWVFIVNGSDYFARDTPELLRNTWSLALEEQFYIVLPLLLLVLAHIRKRTLRILPLLVLGTGSAFLMVALSLAGVEPTRIYFGSDTHTFGLLLGAAAATALHRPATAPTPPPGRVLQLVYAAVALAGLVVLGWLAIRLPEGSPESFRGGFQLATVASLAVIWAVTRSGARVGRALDAQPLRWLGERSYGIYLWHWPLLLLIGAAGRGLRGAPVEPWIIGLITLVVTLVLAAASYRYIEQPVRTLGLRASIRLLLTPARHTPRRRTVAAIVGALLLVTVPATAYAVASAPRSSSAEEAISRGQEALERQEAAEGAEGAATDADIPDAERDAPGDGSAHGAETDADAETVVAPEGTDITAVGDSVMLASLPELTEVFPGISVDAAVSRGMGAGADLYADLAAQGELRNVLVVGLGTNGPVQVEDLETIRQIAGTRPVVLVNAHGERDWIPGVNQLLAEFAASHRGIVVADWSGSVAGVPDALAGDGIHPNPSGGLIYAESVRRALDELQQPGEALGFALPRR